MVYQCEKTLKDLGDKVPADEKAKIEGKLDALRNALKGTDIADIKAKQEDLQKDFYEMSSRVYQQAQASQPQGAPDMGGTESQANTNTNASGSDYVDADFKEVDDDKQ